MRSDLHRKCKRVTLEINKKLCLKGERELPSLKRKLTFENSLCPKPRVKSHCALSQISGLQTHTDN